MVAVIFGSWFDGYVGSLDLTEIGLQRELFG